MIINLAWDANPSGENVTAYKVYYGNATGTYNGTASPIDVGNVTTSAFDTNQAANGKIYFALTAENATGESAFSAEIVGRAPKLGLQWG